MRMIDPFSLFFLYSLPDPFSGAKGSGDGGSVREMETKNEIKRSEAPADEPEDELQKLEEIAEEWEKMYDPSLTAIENMEKFDLFRHIAPFHFSIVDPSALAYLLKVDEERAKEIWQKLFEVDVSSSMVQVPLVLLYSLKTRHFYLLQYEEFRPEGTFRIVALSADLEIEEMLT